MTYLRALMCLAFLMTATAATAQDVGDNLFEAGTFEGGQALDAWDARQGWMRDRWQWQRSDDRGFLRIGEGPQAFVAHDVPGFDPRWHRVRLEVDMRLEGFEQGGRSWDVPFYEVVFLNGRGERIGGQRTIRLREDIAGWETRSRSEEVPPGTESMQVRMGYRAAAGTWDTAGVRLILEELGEPPVNPLTIENATRPANPNALDRAPRAVDPGRIDGAEVDEAAVGVTLHVDPAGEADGQTRFTSLAEAFDVARDRLSEGRGVRLALSPGVHRVQQMLNLDGEDDPALRDAVLVIEGIGDEPAVIAGSVASSAEDWELIDADRGIYRWDWPHDWGMHDDGYYSVPHVELHRREMLWLDGRPLRMVMTEGYRYTDRRGRVYNDVGLLIEENVGTGRGREYVGWRGLDVMEPGTFAVNTHGPGDAGYDDHPHPDSMLLRLPEGVASLDGAVVEIGWAEGLITLAHKNNVVLRNLTFRHSSNFHNARRVGAALNANGWGDYVTDVGNWLIEDCHFGQNLYSGMNLFWVNGLTMRNVRVDDNGGRGAFLQYVQDVVVEDSSFDRNNWNGQRFGFTKHQAGGVDWRAQDAVFRNVQCNDNFGTGFRADVVGSNLLFENSRFNGNANDGMFHEIQFGPIALRGCELIGNERRGLFLLNAHDVVIEDSRLQDNGHAQLSIMNSPPRTTDRDMNARGNAAVPIRQVLNTTIRHSVLSSDAGPESYLIERTPGGGNAEMYVHWYEQQYTGENNRFYNPDAREVFTATTAYEPRNVVDLPTWVQISGEQPSSRWAPAP
jgi:hypothetical protein